MWFVTRNIHSKTGYRKWQVMAFIQLNTNNKLCYYDRKNWGRKGAENWWWHFLIIAKALSFIGLAQFH